VRSTGRDGKRRPAGAEVNSRQISAHLAGESAAAIACFTDSELSVGVVPPTFYGTVIQNCTFVIAERAA
jgi:hypothetical protein